MFNEEKNLYALKLTCAILCSMLLNSMLQLPFHLGIIGIISLIGSCTSLKQMEYKSTQMFLSTLLGCVSIVPLLGVCTLYQVAALHWLLVVIAYGLSNYFSLTIWFVGRIFNIIFFSLASYVSSPLNQDGMLAFMLTRIMSVIIGACCSWGMNTLLVSRAHVQQLAQLLRIVVEQSMLLIQQYTAQPLILTAIEEELVPLQHAIEDFTRLFVQYEHKYSGHQQLAMTNVITVAEEFVLFVLSCKSYVFMYQLSQGYSLFYEKRILIFAELMTNRYREYQAVCQPAR